MKHFLSKAFVIYTLFYARAAFASSMLDSLKKVGKEAYGGEQPQEPKVIIENIVRVLLGFLGFIFIILIIWGGIQWMTSGGNEKKIAEAKQRILNATIGLTIVFVAYSIARFIFISLMQATGDAKPTSGN
ncbi:MAG: hypothetical protein AAB490_02150 [Patescibacteria group bacterium]